MSRDPFQYLRELNPMPDDRQVHPPLSAADRIAGGPPRRPRPARALAVGLALAVLVGGGSWLLWVRGADRQEAATTAPATTLTPTTSTPAPTTVVPALPEGDAVIYLVVDDDGTQVTPGPYLIAVARPYSILSHFVEDPVYETLTFLLGGPYPGAAFYYSFGEAGDPIGFWRRMEFLHHEPMRYVAAMRNPPPEGGGGRAERPGTWC